MVRLLWFRDGEHLRKVKRCLAENSKRGLLELAVLVDNLTVHADTADFVSMYEFLADSSSNQTDLIDDAANVLYESEETDWKEFPEYYRAYSRVILFHFSFLAYRP